MTKNKLIFFVFLAFSALEVNAQNATTASGGDAIGVGGSVAYSVGQVAFSYSIGSSGSVNQGVQQPYELLSVGINNHPNISLLMYVYPNPSVSQINLNVGKQDLKNLSFQLFDVQGKLVMSQKVASSTISINMEGFNTGNYLLKVIDKESELKTFKIIKN